MKKIFVISFIFFSFSINIISMEIRNIILITVDTWRYDYFSFLYPEKVKTPHIDNFAKKSIVFSKAFTTAPLTAPAHASIFTGLYPYTHGIRDNFGLKIKDNLKTMAEFLLKEGYETYGFVSSATVSDHYGFSRGFKMYDDQLPLPKQKDILPSQRPGEKTLERALKVIDWKGKNFLFIHFFEPHYPYDPPKKYMEKYPENYYAGEVAYVDEILGSFFKNLEINNVFDNAIIILTSDHGEGLGNREEKTHGYLTYNDTLKVPLIFFYPGVKPEVLNYPVSHIDILPTILDFIRAKKSKTLPGKNLLNNQIREIYFESLVAYRNFGLSKIYGLIKEPFKIHIKEKNELYNINEDPEEKIPLKDQKKEKELLKIFSSTFKIKEDKIAERENIKNLYSLGYFGKVDLGVKGDPVDYMRKINLIDDARSFFFINDFEKAKILYYNLLNNFPTSSIINDELGVVLFYLNKLEEAEDKFQKAIKFNENNVEAYVHLANLYQEKSMFERAIEMYERALKINPKHPEGLYNYAIACIKSGKEEKAKALFKIYIGLYPEDPEKEKILNFVDKNKFSK